MKLKTLLVASLVYLLVLIINFNVLVPSTKAQTVPAQSTTMCYSFPLNMHYGADDSSAQNEVTSLQTFLSEQGYFNSADLGTGHFGPLTLRAVVKFQSVHALPSTGYFGPMTRGVIAQIESSCTPNPTPTPQSAVTLYSVSPSFVQVGNTVTVTGFGMATTNTILLDGSVAARDVSVTSSAGYMCMLGDTTCHPGIHQTLTFTIPSSLSPNCPVGSMCPMYMRLVTPGSYTLTVVNANGSSNALPLTITAGSSTSSVSITSLDAPSTLQMGRTSTWTVHASTLNSNRNLHYSVVWGDEGQQASASFRAPDPVTVQTSASFTHAYTNAGTYSPVFTVTTDSGESVSSTNTITVTPIRYY